MQISTGYFLIKREGHYDKIFFIYRANTQKQLELWIQIYNIL